MTGVLDRPVVLESTSEPALPQARRRGQVAMAPAMRWAVATLSAAAGAIHLAMVPSHWGESIAEGLGFAAAGWFQLLLAWVVLARPARALLASAMLANLALIGAWVWSRTAGLPIGDHAGHAERAGFVDLTTVGFEVAAVVAIGLALLRGGIGRRWPVTLVPLAVVGLATAAMASPSARDHAAHSHDEVGVAASTHDHGGATEAAAVDDKGLAALSNGHHHEMGPEQPLDRATRAELTRQIALTQEVARRYPTIGAAVADGYRRAGPFSPGLGTHYTRPNGEALNGDGVMSDPDLLSPLALIYAGNDPDAPIAGFMYYSMAPGEPEGFAGQNDLWHYHTNTCIKPAPDGIDAPFGADNDVPASLCQQAGGTMLEQTQWMVHVWSVPGWESQQGLFGEVNPALSCPDGTYHILPMEQWLDHPLNVCASEATA